MTPPNLTIEVLFGPNDLADALRADVLDGLTSRPKDLPPKWFYDERGSDLFEAITELPEYYLTGREREILETRSNEIAQLAGAETLVEFGSGASTKTRLLLDALSRAGLRRFVPFDVSETFLRSAAGQLARDYPELTIHGVAGDFERHIQDLPRRSPRLAAFLGSTIGNLEPTSRKSFLSEMSVWLAPGDAALIGFDLVKDVDRLEAAYNDSAGVTADFNRNVLRVINSNLGANFEPETFEHVARFDPDNEWIEMNLRATRAHTVTIEELGIAVDFEDGESMRTEISVKFRRDRAEADLSSVGLEPIAWWTDKRGDFALSLSRRH